jgi:formylglycine-generating enzyme required for sulfatase activity
MLTLSAGALGWLPHAMSAAAPGGGWRSVVTHVHANGCEEVSIHIAYHAGTRWRYLPEADVWIYVLAPEPAGFALIPAGIFEMGDHFTDGMSNEHPVHTVDIAAFYMGRTEVTKAQWDTVRAWAVENGYPDLPEGGGKGLEHPVHSVSWFDAVKWLNAWSEKDGLNPVYRVSGAVMRSGQSTPDINYADNGYRLPTEAEWEKAARGGLSRRRFPWGDTITHRHANFESTTNDSYDISPTRGYHPSYNDGTMPYTSPVGSFAPNGHALYDMAGNVLEWCNDWFVNNYYNISPTYDPIGPASGSNRVIRGGGWGSPAIRSRATNRVYSVPNNRNISYGFRAVRGLIQDIETDSRWQNVIKFSHEGGWEEVSINIAYYAGARWRYLPEASVWIYVLEPEPAGFAMIPAGSFEMGDHFSDGLPEESPVHTVYVSAFYIGRTEVTKALWNEVFAWAVQNGYTDLRMGIGKGPDHPVNSVTWYSAVKWLNAWSEKDGLNPVYRVSGAVMRRGTNTPEINYSANGYRLPTEAEWEKAARGGLFGKRFPWGDEITHSEANYNSSNFFAYDVSPTLGRHPDYDDGYSPFTAPVGSFAPNGYGLYDMAGNLWEWCNDWFSNNYYSVSPTYDPNGIASGSSRVVRGGSYGLANYCRVTHRFHHSPGSSINNSFGFRPARSE